MTNKKTLGWNPTYFGEPKKGSLAAVVQDITDKQNAVVGEKPEVQSSAAVQAKEQQDNQEAMNPAQQAAIAIDMKKKGKFKEVDPKVIDRVEKMMRGTRAEKDSIANMMNYLMPPEVVDMIRYKLKITQKRGRIKF